MKLHDEKIDDVLVIRIDEEEINVHNANNLADHFDKVLQDGHTKIVVNFQNVNFIDSSGIAVIIDLLRQLKEIKGKLRIFQLNRRVKALFEVTKTHALMDIHPTQADALENF
ncbi:MAG: STAS domain-containing protein [Candidatus Omnitrophica bacterium]|nr:STAS domain-containing protein [Candidatus Omnitrophota bacterium]